jgi:hypothetical protein
VGDLLRLAILQDFKILGFEPFDLAAFRIRDYGVHLNEVDGDADGGVRRFLAQS